MPGRWRGMHSAVRRVFNHADLSFMSGENVKGRVNAMRVKDQYAYLTERGLVMSYRGFERARLRAIQRGVISALYAKSKPANDNPDVKLIFYPPNRCRADQCGNDTDGLYCEAHVHILTQKYQKRRISCRWSHRQS